VLAHELRHALQDQYMNVHGLLPDSVSDFDDRRLALLGLLEGDATLVMERYLARRLPGLDERALDLGGLALPAGTMEGTPAVLRDQMVQPYLVGHDFARALQEKGGWEAVKAAWLHPPDSTEQLLHPDKFQPRELPRRVSLTYAPAGGRLLNEGVLGELLIRTLLGDETPASAAAGWGGDQFRVWDVSGRTLLVWRSEWDTPTDVVEFLDAAHARFTRSHGPSRQQEGMAVFGRGAWSVAMGARDAGAILIVSDDVRAFQVALGAAR
jgi:hypothetical protein